MSNILNMMLVIIHRSIQPKYYSKICPMILMYKSFLLCLLCQTYCEAQDEVIEIGVPSEVGLLV